ncbi:MAG TPA: PEGA domain-containing protein, partial [Myxococcota bacterium]|nr:PEGA domain-containing protein [Myxococcota bacterium]
MSILLLASMALAAPEVVLVGIHIPGLVGNEAVRAEDRLEEALKAASLQPISAEALAPTLAGKEGLLIEDYALGPGKQLVQEARILYDRAQPGEAIPPLTEGIEMLSQALQFAGSGRELQDALLLLALCHLANGEEDAAKDAFSRAATLDPLRTLENASYSPEARSLFEEAKGRVSAQTTGRLWVMASADAAIYLDGRQIGSSPVQDFPVAPGEHTVVARGPKGSTFRDDVRVEASKTTRVEAALERRNLGQAQESPTGRSLQTRYLYQALGRYSEAEL